MRPPFPLLDVQFRRDVNLVGDIFPILLPLADAFGEQILNLPVHRAEVILRPGRDGGVQLGGEAKGNLLFRVLLLSAMAAPPGDQ